MSANINGKIHIIHCIAWHQMSSTRNYVYPSLSTLNDSSEWLAISKETTPYADVLNHEGLLTDQLKLITANKFEVECISQKYDGDDSFQRRDVALLVDEIPRVLASTIIPSEVLKKCPTLLTLGDNPIGEHLETTYAAIRSKPTIKNLAESNTFNVNFNDADACCMRKYHYNIGNDAITIVELFSSKVLFVLGKHKHA